MKLYSALSAIALSLLVFGYAAPAEAVVPNGAPPPGPVTFSDGSVATPVDHCGDTDLCATVTYKGGETLSMYSEGAAFCQPYLVLFNRTHGPTTVYTFTRAMNHDAPSATGFGSRCGNTQPTQLTLDHGLVHLTVDEYQDGTLRFTFSDVTKK